MPLQTLRYGAIEEIRRNLNRGFLTAHSFDIKANSPDGILVQVTYKDRPEFSIAIVQPESDANTSRVWRTIETPGRHFVAAEIYDHQQFQQAYGSIWGWADRVAEEILLQAKSGIAPSAIEDLRRNVEEAANNLVDPDKPFSEEEIDDWSERFKALIARLTELEKQNEIQSGRVNQLASQLEELKKQGTVVPKRTWVKAAGNKILDFFDTGAKAAIKAAAEGAVKALLEHKP
ncbi:MAG: hypothetical protein Q8M20_13770 [Rhodocyclaceae bacterium]|nr:hypothetical protein [Rhodocyclaceae bacterium]MDZ4216068.1 hypothetical protein [Rhodocyclaceae bacterium]